MGERIRSLWEHPAEAARMGLAAPESVLERITWDAAVNRCLEALRCQFVTRLLSGCRPRYLTFKIKNESGKLERRT